MLRVPVLRSIALVFCLLLAVCAGSAQAALLNVAISAPIISCDSNGSMTYDASSGQLNIDGTPVSVDFADGSFAFVDAPRAVRVRLLVNSAGLASSNGTTDDLVIEGSVDVDGDGTPDYAGVLLTGKIHAFGFEKADATNSTFDYVFTATSGSMAGLFAAGDIGMSQSSENCTFTGAFTSSFVGGPKCAIGMTPKPVTRSISGKVICDKNSQPVSGATITVKDSDGNVVDTATTSEDGTYLVEGLPLGTYSVTVTAPTGSQVSGSDTVTVVLTDADGVADFVACAQLQPCDTDLSGKVTKPSCHCYSKPVANVTIEVLDSTGTVVATAVTGEDGTYSIKNLPAGAYSVRIVPPTGYAVYSCGGDTIYLTMNCGDAKVVNFKVYPVCPPGKIVGTVKANCKPIADVTVTLYNAYGSVKGTDTTDANGNYSFENLPAGYYTVKVTVPTGYTAYGKTSESLYLHSGQTYDVDFYLKSQCQPKTGTVTGTVKTSCKGVANVTVQAFSGSTLKGTATTNCEGKYTISNLPAGSYTIKETVPSGYTATSDTSVAISLAGGETKTVNFTLSQSCNKGKITGTVKAGCKGGVYGVTVKVYSGCTLKGSATTDASGNYTIDNLSAGNYTVKIVVPSGYQATTDTCVNVGLSSGETETVNFGLSKTTSCYSRCWW